MNPRGDDDGLADGNVDGVACEVRDDEHVNVVTSKRLAEHRLPDFVFISECAHLVDEVALVSVGERVAVGEKDRVVIVCRHALQRKDDLRLNVISKERA